MTLVGPAPKRTATIKLTILCQSCRFHAYHSPLFLLMKTPDSYQSSSASGLETHQALDQALGLPDSLAGGSFSAGNGAPMRIDESGRRKLRADCLTRCGTCRRSPFMTQPTRFCCPISGDTNLESLARNKRARRSPVTLLVSCSWSRHVRKPAPTDPRRSAFGGSPNRKVERCG